MDAMVMYRAVDSARVVRALRCALLAKLQARPPVLVAESTMPSAVT